MDQWNRHRHGIFNQPINRPRRRSSPGVASLPSTNQNHRRLFDRPINERHNKDVPSANQSTNHYLRLFRKSTNHSHRLTLTNQSTNDELDQANRSTLFSLSVNQPPFHGLSCNQSIYRHNTVSSTKPPINLSQPRSVNQPFDIPLS